MGDGQPIAVDLEVRRFAVSQGRDVSKDRRQVYGRKVGRIWSSRTMRGREAA